MSNTKRRIHIGPKKKWFDIDIKGLWHYRDLYLMYIKRNIITSYKQTALGPLWFIIQPVITTYIYVFAFGKIVGIPTDGIPKPLFYLSGIALWNYFSGCFSSCNSVFTSNQSVFGKVYFPRLIVPLASCTSNMLRLFIQLLIFLAFLCYYSFTDIFVPSIDATVLFVPIIIIIVGMHAMAWGMVFSSLTVKYKDLLFLVTFLLQICMYATPIVYPLSFAPAEYEWMLNLNPLTPLFETFKHCCLGVGQFDVSGIFYSVAVLTVMMFLSLLVFNRTEQDFMDTV